LDTLRVKGLNGPHVFS